MAKTPKEAPKTPYQIEEERVAEAVKNAKPRRDADKGKKWYINPTMANVYTEGGCCRPADMVQLTDEQAKKYDSLKPYSAGSGKAAS